MRVTTCVEIDLEEIVEELSDSEQERLRKFLRAGRDLSEVHRAIVAIRQGRIDDGIAMLEREFFPVHASESACRAAYDAAMRRS